jgi:hypothetical protein
LPKSRRKPVGVRRILQRAPDVCVPYIADELAASARFAGLLARPQHQEELAAEIIFRFTFRSLCPVS